MDEVVHQIPWIMREIPFAIVIYFLIILITVPRILEIKTDATDALLWLMTVVLIPGLGAVLFWVFGDPAIRHPFRRLIRGGTLHSIPRQYVRTADEEPKYYQLQRLLAELGESEATIGNDIRFYTDGRDLYRELEEELLNAQHEICVQFYIYRGDRYGGRFCEILMQKALAGVKCYFLYDAVGANMLSDDLLKRMKKSGVIVYPFLPFKLLRRRVQMNFRNHRKIVVIDRRIAFTGGMNVGEEYAGEAQWAPHWFDTHMRVTGPAVPQIMETFISDYVFSASERKRGQFAKKPEWFDLEPIDTKPVPTEKGVVQTVSAGPDQQINRIRALMFFAATRAQRRLWIASPYFVPDDAMASALITAAYAGLDVRLVTQNEQPDRKVAHLAARYFFAPMIRAGVRVYQYHPGMMHSKMMLVDDNFATVGSANLDVRSMKLNFELNLAFYSQYEINVVENILEESFKKSVQLDEAFLRRPLPIKIAENFCRLFAPVL